MKHVIMAILSLVFSSRLALAEPAVWDLRGQLGDTEPDRVMQAENLPTDLFVRVAGVSFLVPAGWSFGVAEDSSLSLAERNLVFLSYVILAPTTDLENELTYLSIIVKKYPSGITLDRRAAIWSKKPDWDVHYEMLQAEPWIVGRYPWLNSQDDPSHAWAAIYESADLNFEIIVIAQTPVALAAQYAGVIEVLLQQVRAEP